MFSDNLKYGNENGFTPLKSFIKTPGVLPWISLVLITFLSMLANQYDYCKKPKTKITLMLRNVFVIQTMNSDRNEAIFLFNVVCMSA